MGRWPLFLTLVLGLSAPAQVLAQGSDNHDAAEEWFRQGRYTYDRLHDYKRALELFQNSHALEPGRGKLLNIALCEEQLGQLGSALEHFQELVTQFQEGDGDDRLRIVREHIADLGPRVPRLRVDIAVGAPTGTLVTLDAAPLAPSVIGTEIPTNPGDSVLLVTAPGRTERRYDLTLVERKHIVVVVEPGPSPRAPPVVSAEPAPDFTRSLTPGIALGALGVAGIVTGGTFLGLRQAQISDAEERRDALVAQGKTCVPGKANYDSDQCAQQSSATKKGDTFGSVALVGFAAGALATAGALTYFLWPAPKPGQASKSVVRLAPAAGSAQRGIVIWGSF